MPNKVGSKVLFTIVWFFSAISAYLCDLCVNSSRENYLTQSSQRYAEIAEKNFNQLKPRVNERNFRG